MRKLAIAVAAAGIALSGAACGEGSSSQTEGRKGGTLRINLADDTDHTDPALAYYSVSWQYLYATCVMLLNYPDKPAPEGSRLQPEGAARMPEVSGDGKTYTFTVRDGFKFSPPSNAAVTAENFAYAIERVLHPDMKSPGAQFAMDIVGAAEFNGGKADRITGIEVAGDQLTIRLTRVAPDFLARIAMPFFCAVPTDTPINPRGELTVPTAGPYYVASRTRNTTIELRRNPNYSGDRPRSLDSIVYTVGVAPATSVLQIRSGEVDYAADGLAPAAHGELGRDWGPDSDNAANGKQRYFVDPILAVEYIALNTSRPLFADVRMRQAVNYAIDRAALIRQAGAYAGTPTDQYLPPGVLGFEDADIYPLEGPDLEKARELTGGRRAEAVLYTYSQRPYTEIAEVLRQSLAQIGLDVEIKQFPPVVQATRAGTRGEAFDLAIAGWYADYADPANFLNVLLDGTSIAPSSNLNKSYFDDPTYNRRLQEAAGRAGDDRAAAYAQLDEDLARDAAPMVAYMNPTERSFFSERIGCQIFQPVYRIDLAALCVTGG